MGLVEIVGAASAVLIATISTLIAADVRSHAPEICEWLIKRAVKFAPQHLRARLIEEWKADIHETPGVCLKILAALGFFIAALRVRNVEPVPEAPPQKRIGKKIRLQVHWGRSSDKRRKPNNPDQHD